MSLIHDIIKIKYFRLGYLPNYPYHMISDKEMFNAFINLTDEDTDKEYFFEDNYPNPFLEQDLIYNKLDNEGNIISSVSLKEEYNNLKQYIITKIKEYLAHQNESDSKLYVLPDWIYSYMLGEVVYTESDYQDIYDVLALLGENNTNNQFTNNACAKCYVTSLKYISKLTTGIRPPTVFGEPHVIKQLRLEA